MFLDQNFMLRTETARKLYHEHAAALPIIDYHCHIGPKEIAQDATYDNITQVWLYGDHYKWTAMRSDGVDEKYVTGDASDEEKFLAWAGVLPRCIGNPLYHWSHLELKRYFGFNKPLGEGTATEAWEVCNQKLRNGLSVRKIIQGSNVEVICTTDDPLDSLEWHEMIAKDDSFSAKVYPAFRPDPIIDIEKAGYGQYVARLGGVCGITIADFSSLMAAVESRIDYFADHGCRVSDHALVTIPYRNAKPEDVDTTIAKALSGKSLTETEREQYQTAVLAALAKAYAARGWVMQLHFGALRDVNTRLMSLTGPAAGGDIIGGYGFAEKLAPLLDELDRTDSLPKTILYSINPADNALIDTLIGCFQRGPIKSKIQHGSAWWFNDTKRGMEDQLISLASLGVLGNFIGMLTDSRSVLSYTRHEYFRRILCNVIGGWAEADEYPNGMELLSGLIRDICYGNAKMYFGFA